MSNKLALLLLAILAFSCNKEKIADLEFENSDLQQKVELLERQVKILEFENDRKTDILNEMKVDMDRIQIYARSASDHASSASFWAQSGDSFLYRSEIEQRASDFESIVHIASKY